MTRVQNQLIRNINAVINILVLSTIFYKLKHQLNRSMDIINSSRQNKWPVELTHSFLQQDISAESINLRNH